MIKYVLAVLAVLIICVALLHVISGKENGQKKLETLAKKNLVVSKIKNLRYYEDRIWFEAELSSGGVISFSGLDESSFIGGGRVPVDRISNIDILCKRDKQSDTVQISYAFDLVEFVRIESNGEGFITKYDDAITNYERILVLINKLPKKDGDTKYFFPKNSDEELGSLFCFRSDS